MLSAATVTFNPLISGVRTGLCRASWTAPTFVAVVVSLISLGFTLWSWFWVYRRRLVLDRDGHSKTDAVIEAGTIGTGTLFSLNTVVINASVNRTIVIREFCVKLPWKDDLFELLNDPQADDPPSDYYKFPATGVQHPREKVINHKRNAEGVLPPGCVIKGLLLAYSPTPIAQQYRQRNEVVVQISVLDERGKRHRRNLKMWIHHGREKVR
jgi:hypothetical protein